MEDQLPAEEFRNPANVMLPDIRGQYIGVNSIDELYKAVEQFNLGEHVPESIRIQFDTVRNLFLHSYFVYRFFPIAKHQLFVTLEHAIRECISDNELDAYRKMLNKSRAREAPGYSKGLKLNLTYLVNHGLIRNEDFSVWQEGKARAAEEQYRAFVWRKMEAENLESYEWNESEIDYEGVDYEHDYVSVLSDILPKVRNSLAHGSTYMSPTSTIDFEIVSVIINKIFERVNVKKGES